MRTPTKRLVRTLLPTLFLLSSLGLPFTPPMTSRRDPPAPSAAPTQSPAESARETYGRIPLSFEANRGQAEGSFDFLARGAGYALFLKSSEATLVLSRGQAGAQSDRAGGDARVASGGAKILSASPSSESKVLRMTLVGADAAADASGADELAGK